MSTTKARGFIRARRRVSAGRLIFLPPRRRSSLLLGTALGSGSLANFGGMLAKPRRRWLSAGSALAAGMLGGIVFLPVTGALAASICVTQNAWVCTSNNGSGNVPEATLTPTATFTIAIGTSGSADKYTDNGPFNANNSAALVISNSNNESGVITETTASVLTGNEGDGLRFYDTSPTATPTITFNLKGTIYGGNYATSQGTPERGDAVHIGQTGTHAPDVEASIGTLNVNVGTPSVTDAVLRGADDGLYIAQNITTQATVTNYGTIRGKGLNESEGAPDGTNWGEGVHISRVDQGLGDTYQISGAATVDNYGIIIGTKNTSDSDADGPGSGVNISADGAIDIVNGTATTYSSASITGTDGVVAYGGGTSGGDISLTNYGHISGSLGVGADLSNANNISVGNHSLGSMIGTTNGEVISDANTANYDNRGGLTAGLATTGSLIGNGLYIHDINGVASDPPQYAVTVDNRSESGGPGGILAGGQYGLTVFNVDSFVSYVAGENGVFIDNSGAGSGESGVPGGLIVDTAASADGVQISQVHNGDVTIDNSNTRNGATNNLSASVIDPLVGYDAVPTSGTSLFDALVSGTDPDYTYALNYVLNGPGYPVAPDATGISTGIWGAGIGIYETTVGGVASIDNANGQIFGQQSHGIFLQEIGAATAQTGTVVDIDNTDNGLIEGGQSSVYLDTIYGDAWLHNGGGTTLGGDYGANFNNVHGSAGIENWNGIIGGGTADGIALHTIGRNVGIWNGSNGAGGVIIGGESGIDASDVAGTFYLGNSSVGDGGGEVLGLSADGVSVDGLGGRGTEGGDALVVQNAQGLIAGYLDGITINDVYGNGSEGDVNRVDLDNGGGLVVGLNGDGIAVTNVVTSESDGISGSLAIGNNDTRTAAFDLADYGSAAFASEGGGLLGVFGGESGLVTGGIFGAHDGIYADNVGGDVSVNNDAGLIVGSAGIGIDLATIGGNVFVYNSKLTSESDGGLIYGGESGVAGSSLGSAYVANGGGVIVGNESDGIVLSSIGTGSNASGDVVDIDNSSTRHSAGGVIVGSIYGIDIEGVGVSYSEGDNGVFIDNSGWDSNGHQHAGGLIVGVNSDAVHIAGAEGDVAIDNRYTRGNGALDLSSEEIGAAAAGLVSPLSEAGDDFLAPATTGIWGVDGNGIYGRAIAGSVSIDNRKGQIVGTKDSGGSAVYLTGVGTGVADTGDNTVVYVDNSSLGAIGATEGDWAAYSLITGGDYAVRLGDIHNGNVVFNNDLGIAYGDEMGFDLNGLTGGDVNITNVAGLIEGHDGSSFVDFPLRTYPADSYGAITIANVSESDGHGGNVVIENGFQNGTEGGAIVGISTASAIYIAGGVATAEIDNGAAWGSEGDMQGGLIVGSGTAVNPVIVLNTSTGEGDLGNGFVINVGIIASTNLYGFTDPDTAGSTGNVAPVYADVQTIGKYVVADGAADGISSSDFLAALGHMNNHNSNLRSGGTAATDVAVASDTGAVDIENDAVLFGVLDLTGWNSDRQGGVIGNSLTNSGVWFTQGTNTLTATEGDSAIRNDGLIQTAFGSESGELTTFNVSDFYNDRPTAQLAYLSMLDGTVGDSNVINGNFHGSSHEDDGSYSYIAIDAYLDANGGAGKADTVTINGQVSGTTGIIVNVAPDSPGGLNTEGILVVQVNSNGDRGVCADPHCKDGDAFYISPASQNYINVGGVGAIQQGAFAWYLQDGDPAGQTNYDLVGDYMPTVYQTPALISGATGIFFDAADVVSDHLFGGHFKDKGQGGGGADLTSDGSDASTTNSALWGRASGSWSDQTASVISGTGPTVDTSFNQNSYNLLAGADFSPNGEGTGMRYGLYGGYAESNLTFDTYNGSAKYEGGTVGGYAAYTNGGFYVDTQVNADFLNMTFNAPSIAPDFQASSLGTTVGVLADVGNRFTGGQYFIEPIASFAYANTTLGSVSSGAASVSFSNGQSVRAGVGARVGVSETDPMGLTELSVLAKLWNEFNGNNTVTLSDGTPAGTDTVTISNGGIFGEVSGSATRFNTARTLSGFVSGGAQFKADATTWRANIGVRTAF